MRSSIDYVRLRQDLINYYGSAMGSYPQAVMKVIEVEKATDGELRSIAVNSGFDLEEYRTYSLTK